MSTMICRVCHKEKMVGHPIRMGIPSICGECKQKEENDKRQAHLIELKTLPLEERIARIEQWIYDYKPPLSPRDTVIG